MESRRLRRELGQSLERNLSQVMPTRIAHFTDIHFTASPEEIPWSNLLSKRLLGWCNLKFRGRIHHFKATPKIVEAFVRDLNSQQLDGIIFTGDVTGLSLETEFSQALQSLGNLVNDSRVVGLPGNHDVYIKDVERKNRFESLFPAWVRSDCSREEFPDESKSEYPYPLLRFFGDDVAFIGLKDSKASPFYDSSGRIPQHQIEALRQLLDREDVKSRQIFLGLHYSLLTREGRRDSWVHRLRNDEEFIDLLKSSNIRIVLSGHIHHRIVHPQAFQTSCSLINPGSLTFEGRDQAYHIFEVEKDSIQASARKYDPQTDSFTSWEPGKINSL